MVLQPAPLCIKCKLPAKIACNACSDAPLYTSRASQGNLNAKGYYCSPECGLEDWDRHKKECGDLVKRKKLYKAGDVLQEVGFRGPLDVWVFLTKIVVLRLPRENVQSIHLQGRMQGRQYFHVPI